MINWYIVPNLFLVEPIFLGLQKLVFGVNLIKSSTEMFAKKLLQFNQVSLEMFYNNTLTMSKLL